jgi:phosphoglycerate dehydrogenase-like enzyme
MGDSWMSHKIIVPDDFPRVLTGTKAESRLKTLGEVRIYSDKAQSQEELIERIREALVVLNIRAYSVFNRRVQEACPKLRMISIWGTGVDNVDLGSAKEMGITVTNTLGANALSVAEHTMTILLSLARQIPTLDREVRAGRWPRVEMVQMSGKVLGLFGLGAIGNHMAKMGRGLGMEVIAWTFHPSPERAKESGVPFVSKEELLQNSDVVSLHLLLTEETLGFLKKEDFARMRPTAFFVNTARAALIEPGALSEALRSKKIAGAALDVYDQEPLPPGDPIANFPNIVLTPHNAGMTPEAMMNGLMMAVENIEAFLMGKGVDPKYRVVQGKR